MLADVFWRLVGEKPLLVATEAAFDHERRADQRVGLLQWKVAQRILPAASDGATQSAPIAGTRALQPAAAPSTLSP